MYIKYVIMVFDNTAIHLDKFITLTIETNIQQFLFDDFDQNEEDGSNVFETIQDISINTSFEKYFMEFLNTYKNISNLNAVKTDYIKFLFFGKKFKIKKPQTRNEYIYIIQLLYSKNIITNTNYYDKLPIITNLYYAHLAEEEYGDLEWIEEQVHIYALNKIAEHPFTNNWLLQKIYIPRMKLLFEEIYKKSNYIFD